jgi:hypothetical protein
MKSFVIYQDRIDMSVKFAQEAVAKQKHLESILEVGLAVTALKISTNFKSTELKSFSKTR